MSKFIALFVVDQTPSSGNSSISAGHIALKLADYVVTESALAAIWAWKVDGH